MPADRRRTATPGSTPTRASLEAKEIEFDVARPGRTSPSSEPTRVPSARSRRSGATGSARPRRLSSPPRSARRSRALATSRSARWCRRHVAGVVLLPVEVALPADRRVVWCVGLHRALVSLIGDGAPALVTGRYEAGVERPPNRLAIQYVASSSSPRRGTGRPAPSHSWCLPMPTRRTSRPSHGPSILRRDPSRPSRHDPVLAAG